LSSANQLIDRCRRVLEKLLAEIQQKNEICMQCD